MGKSTISMAIFNSYVKLPEGILQSNMAIDNPANFSLHRLVRYELVLEHILRFQRYMMYIHQLNISCVFQVSKVHHV